MQPPIGVHSNLVQGMVPLATAMRPPAPPAPGTWPCFPPAQMMNHGFVNNSFRPLDLGNFPPWRISVTVAGGETRHIHIPNSKGNHVIGLPLGSDIPEVIAGRYEGLLRMVQGMRDVIRDIIRYLARCQQDAVRFWQNANRYYCELEELKFRMAGNMVVSQDSM
ncbi:hypothetical protein MKW94_002555, partial [Papaver nudicaule]|nr:hypothetical protein [Papaver nudicaule]